MYRLAHNRALQREDAEDLAKRVLISVRRAIGNWEADPSKGQFHSWVATIARNAIINALTRRPPDEAVGGTEYPGIARTISRSPTRAIRGKS